MIASSSSSPPMRIDCDTTMPPSEMTAPSLGPPPMSTTMFPVGSPTGSPAPIAAAIGSSIRYAWRGPADRQGSSTAPLSPPVTPQRPRATAGAGGQAGLLDGPLLHPGHARGHADHDARVRPAVLVHLLDEVAQHLLGDVEVGDHAVLERADRGDRPRRAAEHPLGLDADGVDLAGARVDRDHRRLG